MIIICINLGGINSGIIYLDYFNSIFIALVLILNI